MPTFFSQKPAFTGTALKYIACLAMLLDHIGAAILQRGLDVPYISILNIGNILPFGPVLNPTLNNLVLCNTIFRAFGRIAFPIYAFLLVEGFLHTKHIRRYLLRLFLFALISEPFFDFAFFGTFYYPNHQNTYFTLFLGLAAISILHHLSTHAISNTSGTFAKYGTLAVSFLSLLLILYSANFLHTDYGTAGVLFLLFLWLTRKNETAHTFAFLLFTLDQFPAPFAIFPVHCYNGKRGKCTKAGQLAFYAFYPVHLALLGAIVARFLSPNIVF